MSLGGLGTETNTCIDVDAPANETMLTTIRIFAFEKGFLFSIYNNAALVRAVI